MGHNRLTGAGASSLVEAVQDRRMAEASTATGTPLPLWLRFEQNNIAQPSALLEELRNRPSKTSSSSKARGACDASVASNCGPRQCQHAAMVHLPYFSRQATADSADGKAAGSNSGPGRGDTSKSSSLNRSPAPEASPAITVLDDEESSREDSRSCSPGVAIKPPPPKGRDRDGE